ncbi:MAG: hypothetical protein GDA47_00290 [Rhodospirillales bacterium]|nr:hypothetical protein [Rhodospirillales bacterium]
MADLETRRRWAGTLAGSLLHYLIADAKRFGKDWRTLLPAHAIEAMHAMDDLFRTEAAGPEACGRWFGSITRSAVSYLAADVRTAKRAGGNWHARLLAHAQAALRVLAEIDPAEKAELLAAGEDAGHA